MAGGAHCIMEPPRWPRPRLAPPRSTPSTGRYTRGGGVDRGVSSHAGLSWSSAGGMPTAWRGGSSIGRPPATFAALPLFSPPEPQARAHTIALNPRLRPGKRFCIFLRFVTESSYGSYVERLGVGGQVLTLHDALAAALLLQLRQHPHVRHSVPRSWNSLPALSRGRTSGWLERATPVKEYARRRDLVTLQHQTLPWRARLVASKPMKHAQLERRNFFHQPLAAQTLCQRARALTVQRATASTSSGRSWITRVALGTSGFDGSSRTSTMSESRIRSTRQLIS